MYMYVFEWEMYIYIVQEMEHGTRSSEHIFAKTAISTVLWDSMTYMACYEKTIRDIL